MLRRTFLSLTAALAPLMALPAFAQQPDQPAQGTAMLPAPSESGYAPVNGVDVYYAVYGQGEPLVLLHGGLMNHEMFGPVLAELASTRQVIGVDLQAHGRTRPFDRPMSFPALATDIAELIGWLGLEKADIMGYSLGGITALRTAIDHPEVVDKLILVSAPYAYSGWHDYNAEGMRQMGAHLAEGMKGSPMHEAYVAVAPDPENWTRLLEQMGGFIGNDFDWSAEIPAITAPTLVVVADYDAVRISHATAFFELLGGGQADAGWDGSGMTQNHFAVIPGATHYDIGTDPRLAQTAAGFLDRE